MNATYRRPSLTPGQQKAVQLELFGFLVKLRTRDVITVREAAEILRASSDFVRDVIELGALEVLKLAAKGSKDKPEYRITVRSFLLYIASISTLSPEDYDDLLVTFVDKQDPRALTRLEQLLTTRRTRLAAAHR